MSLDPSYFPLVPLAWALAILASWVGWGSLCRRVLFPGREADWGLRAAWGMAFSIALGGILNLAGLVFAPVLIAFVATGAAIWLFQSWPAIPRLVRGSSGAEDRGKGRNATGLLLGFAVGALALTRLIQFSVAGQDFNFHDDYYGHLLIPVKMIALGSMEPDPFNYYQLVSYAGQSFLHTLSLAALPMTDAKVIEPGLGLLVLPALLFGLMRKHDAGPFQTAFVVSIPLVLLPLFPIVNVSPLMIMMCLFVALYRTLEWLHGASANRYRSALLIALVAAGLVSLKATALPYAVTLLGAYYAIQLIQSNYKMGVVLEALWAAILTLLILLPWMWLSYRSSGTLFYPLLGAGYAGSGYGSFPAPPDYFAWGQLQDDRLLFLGAGLFLLCVPSLLRQLNVPLIAMSVGTAVSTLMLLGAAAGTGDRYAFPFTMSLVLVLTAYLCASAKHAAITTSGIGMLLLFFLFVLEPLEAPLYTESAKTAATYALGLMAVTTIAALVSPNRFQKGGWGIVGAAVFGLASASAAISTHQKTDEQTLASTGPTMQSVRRAQSSVPEGERFLAKIAAPLLLDFPRNRPWIVSWAHASSLPPGMPRDEGSERLADYLLSNSLRYVLYQPHPDRFYPAEIIECRSAEGAASFIEVATSAESFNCAMDLAEAEFLSNLDELAKTRRIVYDDGGFIVIDLQSQLRSQRR